jgi:pimeloyl-ACP methyl ester carboxylesterase
MKKIVSDCCKIILYFTYYSIPFFVSIVVFGQDSSTQSRIPNGNYLDVGGAKIYFEEEGKGESVVLVHDGLVNSMTWDGEWETLKQKYHVIRYDRRGYGRSDTSSSPFSQIEDLHKLFIHLQIKHATLVGCSSGGGIVIDFSLVYPEMVDRLILIGSVLHGMVVTSQFEERGRKNNAPLKHGDFITAAENWSNDPFTIAPGDSVGKKKLYEALVKYPGNLKYSGNLETRLQIPAVRRLSNIFIPTLILVGEYDMPDVHALEGAIQAGIPGARREIVKGCGHLIPLENSDFLSTRIISFIEKHPRVLVDENILESYTGKYKIWGNAATILKMDHQLFFRFPGEWDIPLFPESVSKMKCFMWGQDAEMEFLKDSSGKVAQVVITGEDNGEVTKCPKI